MPGKSQPWYNPPIVLGEGDPALLDGCYVPRKRGLPCRFYEQKYLAALLGLQRADIGLLAPFSMYLEAPHER